MNRASIILAARSHVAAKCGQQEKDASVHGDGEREKRWLSHRDETNAGENYASAQMKNPSA